MEFSEIKELFDRYVIGNYGRLPVAFVRGEGSHIWDSDGNRYIDLMPGWGTTLVGHCHPRVVTAVQRQASMLLHVDNSFHILPQGELAKALSELSFGGKCFFCNSGAEAVEAAIKLVRLNKQHEGRYKIVTMLESFHGRTMGAITATGQEKYHKGYLPLLPGFEHVPLNDLEALGRAVDEQTCAVMMEPVQGEGGVRPAEAGFMAGVRELCDELGLLLILDEVQTGMGRTGHWFGYQRYGVEPDVMVLSKALGSGVPIGAMVARAEAAESLAPGTHASTFGGNPLACSAALATIGVIEQEGLIEACRESSAHAMERLRGMAERFEIVKEVRGVGLMLGVELDRPGKAVFEECLRERVRINCTQETVLRLLPAMNVPRELLDEGLDVVERALGRAQDGAI